MKTSEGSRGPRDRLHPERATASAAQRLEFAAQIEACLPGLRRYARSLCHGDTGLADDCVQDACISALESFAGFDPDRPFRPWMFRIVRNAYLQRARRSWRLSSDIDGELANALTAPGSPEQRAEALELLTLMSRLPAEFGDALALVAGLGMTYEEAARASGCAVGTMKSRVSRGRALLLEALKAREAGHKPDAALPEARRVHKPDLAA
jgi:RNA polymerase sigma-70 factor, ECF subfamily